MSISFSKIRTIPKPLRQKLCKQNPGVEVDSGSRQINKGNFSFELQKGRHQEGESSSMLLSGDYYRILVYQDYSQEPVARLDYRLVKNIGSPRIKSIVIDKIHNGHTICGRDGIGVEEETFNVYQGLRTSMLRIALTHAVADKYRQLLVQGPTDESQGFFADLPFPMSITRDYHDQDALPNMGGHISLRGFPKIDVCQRPEPLNPPSQNEPEQTEAKPSDPPQLEFEF